MQKYHHTTIPDCAQAGTISSILQVLEQLSTSHVEERQERRESEKRIITALEKVADQGARIVNLESADADIRRNMEALYVMQRQLDEVSHEEDPRLTMLHTFYTITTSKYAVTMGIILILLILIGSINDLAYHSTLFTAITGKILGLLK